jgi:phenylpropionate dioxygenase-like ring-hydroxylating dioxygenase large terminal subunit
MFINFWYPAIAADKLGADTPVRVQMLGQQFVLFRDGTGAARCLADTCAHRGGALGCGRMRNGNVECPYHGWQFDGDGRCRAIPSMGPDARIPARAKVDAYPVQEKYGIVFAFLGDLPETERPPLMPLPEYGTEGWRANLIIYDVQCNYERSIENGLDPGHNEFVHPTHGYEGERADYRVPELDLEDTDWGFGFMTTFKGKEIPNMPTRTAMRTNAAGEFDPDVRAGTWHHGPAQMVTKIHMAKSNYMHQYLFECPLDEVSVRVYLVNMRNCLLDEQLDAKVVDRCMAIARQDIVVLEKMMPVRTPRSASHEVLVPADVVIGRYRQFLQQWQERGWRIDSRRLREASADRDQAFAIPCPARRTEKNWALEPLPLIPPRASMAAAGRN